MTYALIGKGKTGQAILDMLPAQEVVAICDRRHPVTVELLHTVYVGIVFVPGNAFKDIEPILPDAAVPLVNGTTGYAWPPDLDVRLKERQVASRPQIFWLMETMTNL